MLTCLFLPLQIGSSLPRPVRTKRGKILVSLVLKDIRFHLCAHKSTANYMVRSLLSFGYQMALDKLSCNVLLISVIPKVFCAHMYVYVCAGNLKALINLPVAFCQLWSPDCASLFWLHLFEHQPHNHACKYTALKRRAAIFIRALTKCIWNHSDFVWAEPSALAQYQSDWKTLRFKAWSLTTLIILIKRQIECVG